MSPKNHLSARQVWQQLQKDAGLELRRKGGGVGRDADVEDAVFNALAKKYPSAFASGSVGDCLAADEKLGAHKVTVETLLVAVLTSQRDFAAMMIDVLRTLVRAESLKVEHALSVEFRFDEVSDPIRMTLEQFRECVARIRKVLEWRFELPDAKELWDLWKHLQQFGPGHLNNPPPGFPPVPRSPKTGHEQLDEVFGSVIELTTEFRKWCLQFGDDRSHVWQAVRNQFPDDANPAHKAAIRRAGAATDYWDVSTIDAVSRIDQRVREGTLDAGEVVTAILPSLTAFPRNQQWIDQTYAELLDILNLPIWRKRHELYSVWTGCVLLSTAADNADDFRFHATGGVLSFAFGGSQLATYQWNGEQFDIWAELRSALVGQSAKRKKGIQPDFRVVRGDDHGSPNKATCFVLECKHYLRTSVANFTQAVSDYARSCPAADVFLVNHGPADHDLLAATLDPSLSGRVRFIGNATAESEPRSHLLQDSVKQTLFPVRAQAGPSQSFVVPSVVSSESTGPVATIWLKWDSGLEDIDLALDMFDANGSNTHRIDYRSPGNLTDEPYARLEQDIRHGPGQEVIEISAWRFSRYEIIATNFSKTGQLLPQHLGCEIVIGKSRTEIKCPILGNSTQWRVGVIEIADGKARVRS